ncbi:hypothetical protein INT43_001817 [Umbelopsis isabellina]|uniref:Alpha/beta hydrolase fold-3 domain-containing protein n=1 Tax=Mortierella isabellina TaxID=91625 RepID=A0A8H7UDI3_MORIS|nr:hypothetical protein INT43_001817 [Umbelopsis isabellina]
MLSIKAKVLRLITRPFLYTKEGGDVQYLNIQGETRSIRVLKYLPPNQGKHPVHINLHGGGYTLGVADWDNFWCRRVADETSAVVFNIDYAKAPEYPFPAAIHDVRDVIASLSGDPDLDLSKLSIGGFSAGGGLACAYILYCMQNDLPIPKLCLPTYGYLDASTPYSEILAAVPEEVRAKSLPTFLMDLFRQSYTTDYDNYLVSPVFAPDDMLAKFPRTVVLTGELDSLHVDADKFADRLRENGVDVVHHVYEGAAHGWTHHREGEQNYNGKAKEESLALMIHEIKRLHDTA